MTSILKCVPTPSTFVQDHDPDAPSRSSGPRSRDPWLDPGPVETHTFSTVKVNNCPLTTGKSLFFYNLKVCLISYFYSPISKKIPYFSTPPSDGNKKNSTQEVYVIETSAECFWDTPPLDGSWEGRAHGDSGVPI